MDGLFTVFGLGTAFGVFCSWMYDVIRKRNLPVSRGASFEAFHGSDVMPAPEPLVSQRSSEPVFHVEQTPARIEPLPSFSPAAAVNTPVVRDVLVGAEPSTAMVGPTKDMAIKEKVASTTVDLKDPLGFNTTQALDIAALNIEGLNSNAPAQVPTEVVFTQADASDDTIVNFDAPRVSFEDTVSFYYANIDLPTKPRAPRIPGFPRVVLLVNNAVVRDVQENDLPGLMTEFGILADSEQAQLFQGGDPVTIGRTSVQLAQV